MSKKVVSYLQLACAVHCILTALLLAVMPALSMFMNSFEPYLLTVALVAAGAQELRSKPSLRLVPFYTALWVLVFVVLDYVYHPMVACEWRHVGMHLAGGALACYGMVSLWQSRHKEGCCEEVRHEHL